MEKHGPGISSQLDGSSHAGAHRVVAAWATRAISLAVSGRLAVVVAVDRGSQGRALVTVFGSLLARGYLDSRVVPVDAPARTGARPSDTFEDTVASLTGNPAGWLPGGHLRPVSAEMASRLAWGMYLTSVVFKCIDRSRVPAPGQGLIPAPPGQPCQWLDGFLARFGPEQLDVAREIARRPHDRQGGWPGGSKAGWQGPPAEPPDVSTAVSFELQLGAPLGLRASLERLPEFQPYSRPDQFMWLRRDNADRSWRHREPEDVVATAPQRIAGILHVTPGGVVVANVASATAAAALAARLEELTRGRLSLRSCTWYPDESSRGHHRPLATPDRPAPRPR